MEKINKTILAFGIAIVLFALAFCLMFLQEPSAEVIFLILIFCFLLYSSGINFVRACMLLYEHNNKVKLELLKIKINPTLLTKMPEDHNNKKTIAYERFVESVGFLILSVVFYLFI